jgi:CRP-like cAMP-binding protein
MDFELEIQRLGIRDIIGEMSFVDSEAVSTDVIAVGDVEMSIIDRETLERILRTDPLFYGRFFHAISKTLAMRLRSTNEKVSQFSTE